MLTFGLGARMYLQRNARKYGIVLCQNDGDEHTGVRPLIGEALPRQVATVLHWSLWSLHFKVAVEKIRNP